MKPKIGFFLCVFHCVSDTLFSFTLRWCHISLCCIYYLQPAILNTVLCLTWLTLNLTATQMYFCVLYFCVFTRSFHIHHFNFEHSDIHLVFKIAHNTAPPPLKNKIVFLCWEQMNRAQGRLLGRFLQESYGSIKEGSALAECAISFKAIEEWMLWSCDAPKKGF